PLPRVGYRFIVPVEWLADGGGTSALPWVVEMPPRGPTVVPPLAASEERPRPARVPWRFALLVIGLLLLAGFGGYLLRPRRQKQPETLTIIPFKPFPGLKSGPAFRRMGTRSLSPGTVLKSRSHW